MKALKERHPYITAHQAFVAGRIPTAQAIGMVLVDREFIAECEMSGKDKRAYAQAIVTGQWARELIANRQQEKRANV
jgi:hypothetical protein